MADEYDYESIVSVKIWKIKNTGRNDVPHRGILTEKGTVLPGEMLADSLDNGQVLENDVTQWRVWRTLMAIGRLWPTSCDLLIHFTHWC